MALTKSASAVWNGQSLSAGGGPTTSSAVTITDSYDTTFNVKLTNGATGPTTAAEIQCEVSEDNTEWYKYGGPFIGSLVNSAVVSLGGVALPRGTQFVRFVATHPTGQAVTVDLDVSEVTAL